MTCPTRQQPGIGLNVHVRTFKYIAGRLGMFKCVHVQSEQGKQGIICSQNVSAAYEHTHPYTHRYNFVIVAVAIQPYRVHRLSFVLCADCHLTLVCLRSCSFMFFVVMLLLLMLPLFCFLFAHRHATRQRKAKALLRQHIATLQKV